MSLRIREDGRVLCAAMHPAEKGDCYIDDGVHYLLSITLGLLVTEQMEMPENVGRGGHARHGQWWWYDDVPADVVPDLMFDRPKMLAASGGDSYSPAGTSNSRTDGGATPEAEAAA